MDKIIVDIIASLENLSNEIIRRAGGNSDNTFASTLGAVYPVISPKELAEFPKEVISKLKIIENSSILEKTELLENVDLIEKLKKISTKIDTIVSNNSITYFYNGHGKDAIPGFLATMVWINMQIDELVSFEKTSNPDFYPTELKNKIYRINEEIHSLTIDKEELENKIKKIEEAHNAASNLPATMNDLRNAEKSIKKLTNDSLISHNKIEEFKNKIESNDKFLEEKKLEAEELINKCDEAYRSNTTQGLAKSFEEKANSLSKSIYAWLACLVASLILGLSIGGRLINDLNVYLTSGQIDTAVVFVKLLISLLSLGAPLWFAWLSTKQISERFKLAEDYAFKASVAKAYEGYRKEASRLDEVFEARLFNTALNRLDEEPLRFVNNLNHGSPWHELIGSIEFQNAMKKFPELRDKFIELAKHGLDKVDLKK